MIIYLGNEMLLKQDYIRWKFNFNFYQKLKIESMTSMYEQVTK